MNINEYLAKLDDSRRSGMKSLRDLVSNPRGVIDQIRGQSADDMKNPAAFDQKATEIAMNAAPVGMMIGKKSASWGKEMAKKALVMEKAGADPKDIWKTTGTWKGPDGHWRQEISDFYSGWKGDTKPGTKPPEVGDILDHKSLYYAYPGIDKIKGYTNDRKAGATFYPPRPGRGNSAEIEIGTLDGSMTSRMSSEGKKSALLHELQHAIQTKEKWSPGGSGDAMMFLAEARKKAGEPMSDPYQLYRHLAGEAEARMTQNRMNMPFQERRATFPEKSYDVELRDLLHADKLHDYFPKAK